MLFGRVPTHLGRLVTVRTCGARRCYNIQRDQYWNDRGEPNESKFSKVLIANRGEIACRVIRTCQRLGIKTVAIYSDIERNAVHTKMADEAVCVGTAQTKDSYLQVDRILDAIQQTGAEAVHPGYGFLSENASFSQKLADMGVEFVGPSGSSIKAMGDKIESKNIAIAAKVNTIPGFDGVISDVDHALTVAKDIGYPVMVKASAGGGGKGMRIARDEKELVDGFRLSQSEAASSFGDDRMLIEKFIENPRHIEFQVLCDKHGNAIHLNERECSIQRRNQKVVEEAPSTFLDEKTRRDMGKQAKALAKAVQYSSAGTVEFLVDVNKNFYFLEMNTRLQVEHPITELITGVDLVHQMLRVAKGHRLVHLQKDVPIIGWAIESRVYAEDPTKNFGVPSVGRLQKYEEPVGTHVRCDSGVDEGSDISIFYDPMICKLVSYGKQRQLAIDAQAAALDNYVIRGVTHNISLLRDIMTEPNFVSGNLSTNYLFDVYPEGFKGHTLNDNETDQLHAIATAVHFAFQRPDFVDNSRKACPSAIDSVNIRHTPDAPYTRYVCSARHNGAKPSSYGIYRGDASEPHLIVQFENASSATLKVKLMDKANNSSQYAHVQLLGMKPDGTIKIQYKGSAFTCSIVPDAVVELEHHMPKVSKLDESLLISAPMPGLIKRISAKVGDTILPNQEVCVLEAMKMQNSLAAQNGGVIAEVLCEEGSVVSDGDLLVRLEAV